MTSLTDLETAVLRMILNGDHPVLNLLRPQLDACRAEKRWFTGVGFFTALYVDIATVVQPKLKVTFGDVLAEISGLKHGAGFVLFVENGLLKTLEGYSYDERWPDFVHGFNLRYMDNEARDWKLLNKALDNLRENLR